MHILAMVGESGSGKTTGVGYLVSGLIEYGLCVSIYPLARPIKRKIAASQCRLYDKIKDRKIAQSTGATWRTRNPDVLLDPFRERYLINTNATAMLAEKHLPDVLIIPDVRYRNELEYLRSMGAFILHFTISHQPLYGAAAEHESETLARELDASESDYRMDCEPGLFFNMEYSMRSLANSIAEKHFREIQP